MREEPSRDATHRPATASSTRRGLLSRVGAAAAVAGLAGCSGPETLTVTRSLGESTDGLSATEYRQFATDVDARYGESDGLPDPGEYDHLEFVGAWPHSSEGGGDDPAVESDHVVVLYRVVDKVDTVGREYFRLWQWSGARVHDSDDLGTPTVGRLTNGVQFPQGRVDVLTYAPDAEVAGDRTVSVGLADPSARGPSGRVALHGGTVTPGDSRVGSAGRSEVRWSGRTTPVQTVAGACSVRRPPDVELFLDWTVEVQAETGLL